MHDFLSNSKLYQVYTLLENYAIGNQNYTDPIDFIGETFEYFCEYEEKKTTFELEIDDATKHYFEVNKSNKIPPENFTDEKLNFTFKAIGKCKSCKEYHIIFLLNVFSDKPISNIIDNTQNIAFTTQNNLELPNTNIFIQKIGSLPQIRVLPNKIITQYFDRETNNWYFKGINSINDNYGIGAFAYFRRIVERELIKIIESIKSLPDSHSSEIQKLLDLHKENPKISTIYDNIFQYLPNSLKGLGDNPIKFLYKQTSEGLHTLTEQDCLKKSESILRILDFIIKKINEEKSEIKDLKEAIRSLK